MVQKGKIIEKNGNIYKIEVVRKSSCTSDCSSCKGCGHNGKSVIVEIQSNEKCDVGDVVNLNVNSSFILKLSYLTYIFPIVTMIAGYSIGGTYSEGMGILSAFIGLILPFPFLMVLSRKVQKVLSDRIEIAP